jgi:hypothetical protein
MSKITANVTYVEYYPHCYGASTASFTMTAAEFASLETKFGEDGLTDDENDALQDCIDARATRNVYAFDALLRENKFKKIMKKLKSTGGTWSGEWEEGSFALSVWGLAVAKAAVAKIEAKHLFDDGDAI